MKPEFILTQNLRFIPKDPKALENYIAELAEKVKVTQDISEQVSLQGEIGVYLRSLDLFDEAANILQSVRQKIKENNLGLRKEIQNEIRLAHVFQEAKQFEKSNLLFDEVIEKCRTLPDATSLLHFALQHAGKNEFDQGRYSSALNFFEEALSIRIKESAPPDQIDSTRAAIARVKEVLASNRATIRRAKPEDAKAIHNAHMLSIQTICSKDHSPEEIKAWGGRPFNETQRVSAIQNQNVWVVELDNKIEGYGHLRVYEKDGQKLAHVMGLYITQAALGKKFGQQLFSLMLDEAKLQGADKINLESTLTSHGFYKKMGFWDSGPQMTVELGGTPIRCLPMSLDLWNPMSPDEVKSLLSPTERPYWISGGWAIDLFLGKNTRPHDDIDISIDRKDQLYFQSTLSGWDIRASDPPGSGKLRPWLPGEVLNPPIHNLWCRSSSSGPWNLEVMLCTFENDEWIYRRNPKVRGAISSFGWQQEDGTRVIAPEIQLLYKSRNPRDKDNQDFGHCLKAFDKQKVQWLHNALMLDSGETHPWILRLKEIL